MSRAIYGFKVVEGGLCLHIPDPRKSNELEHNARVSAMGASVLRIICLAFKDRG